MLNQNYLPFYPDLIAETISIQTESISTGSGSVVGNQNLQGIDIFTAHNATPIAQKSDFELLQILGKVVKVAENSSYDSMLGKTLLLLEPQSQANKEIYSQQIWAYLHGLKFNDSTPYGFFNFHVGGAGSFEGAPLVGKVFELHSLHQSITDEEFVNFVVEFPTSLLSIQPVCAKISNEMIEDIVITIYEKIPLMTSVEKNQVKDLLTSNGVSLGNCGYNLKATDVAAETVANAISNL